MEVMQIVHTITVHRCIHSVTV